MESKTCEVRLPDVALVAHCGSGLCSLTHVHWACSLYPCLTPLHPLAEVLTHGHEARSPTAHSNRICSPSPQVLYICRRCSLATTMLGAKLTAEIKGNRTRGAQGSYYGHRWWDPSLLVVDCQWGERRERRWVVVRLPEEEAWDANREREVGVPNVVWCIGFNGLSCWK